MSQISFHRSLYEPVAVEHVVGLFAGLATFEVVEEANEVVVTIHSADPELAGEIEDAFKNHVLYETIHRARTAEDVQ